MIAEAELKFTPLEFETKAYLPNTLCRIQVKIYSVGVWNFKIGSHGKPHKRLKFTPLEFETGVLRSLG